MIKKKITVYSVTDKSNDQHSYAVNTFKRANEVVDLLQRFGIDCDIIKTSKVVELDI